MDLEPRIAVLQDLRLQSFDLIRFASYRTASKLRYIQKSTNRKYLGYRLPLVPCFNKNPPLPHSSPGGHLECHWGISREWSQHPRAAEWSQRGALGDARLLLVSQPKQTSHDSATGAGGFQGESSLELAAGRLLIQRQLGQDQSLFYQGGAGHNVRGKVGWQITM